MRHPVLLIIAAALVSFSCRNEAEVVEPTDSSARLYEDVKPLRLGARAALEGVYRVVDGQDVFGNQVALKWSGVANGQDTAFTLSGFFGKDVAYFTAEGGSLDSTVFLHGTWRKMVNTETGLLRFVILAGNGGRQLMNPIPVIGKDSIILYGSWGNGSENPSRNLVLAYDRPLYAGKQIEVVAHRGGGRTSDLLPVSENSVEMIIFTQRLGSTGIEIDVHLTKDGIPILYHDSNLNLRLTQKSGLVGPIEEYTYDQLQAVVRLIHGERIPTLQQALDAVVYRTSLRVVWLDSKPSISLKLLQQIQSEYLAKAAAIGRTLEIYIGLPSQEKVDEFLALPNHAQTPSLCELSPDIARQINARVWAPRWTLGTQNDLVAQVQSEGRLAFVWTLDVPDYVAEFISTGRFDAILSNYPSIVAYYNYVR